MREEIGETIKIQKKEMMIAFGVLFALTIVLAIRNYYSFCWSDESFFLAGVHRLYLGERPLVDEWNQAQFYAVLLLPFYHAFIKWNGGTEGIYLWARQSYLFLSFLTAYLVFYTVRKKIQTSLILSIMSGALILLYARANVGGPSYHNIYFLEVTMAVMLLIYIISEIDSGRRGQQLTILSVVTGFLLGLSILTIPTMVIGLGILLLFTVFQKWKIKCYTSIIWNILIGITLTGGIYLCFLLSRSSIKEILESFTYLFTDSDHPAVKSMGDYLYNFWWLTSSYGKYLLIMLGGLVLIKAGLMLTKKKMPIIVAQVIFVFSAPVAAYNIYLSVSSHMGPYVVFGLYGVYLLILTEGKEENDSKINRIFLVSALIVFLTFSLASNTCDTMIQGYILLSLLALVLLSKWGKKIRHRNYKVVVCLITTGMLLVMFEATVRGRIMSVYRDAPLEQLDTVIVQGPAKGLITTSEHAKQYDDCIEVMEKISEEGYDSKDMLLIIKQAPWMYLCSDIHIGAPTTWSVELKDDVLNLYYQTHEFNNLKYAIILNPEYGQFEAAMNPEGTDLFPNMTELEGEIWERLQGEEYRSEEFSCGKLFIRNEDSP